jgi:hypothetical protein
MANDPTVKAGSWGPKTVEKILRIQERALKLEIPMVYLVDSAGARITEQVQMFPGRRGAGRIFYNEVKMSGRVPQICLLFGPSAAGGAYIPAFCDVVIMRDGNASMYLGSPRMAEMVIGETVTLDEMGGARMHTSKSGCGHFLVKTDEEAIETGRRYLSYMPTSWRDQVPDVEPKAPVSDTPLEEIIPLDENVPFDIKLLLDTLLDEDSFLEVHKRWAKELIVGYGRLDGKVVGVVANQPKQKGGSALRRFRRQGGPLHRHLQRLQHPAALPGRHPRLHDRDRGREAGHHPPRGQDDLGHVRGDRAEDLGGRAQGVRRRPLRDGRPGLRAGLLPGPAQRLDRRDGAAGRRQRGLLQPDPGDRG